MATDDKTPFSSTVLPTPAVDGADDRLVLRSLAYGLGKGVGGTAIQAGVGALLQGRTAKLERKALKTEYEYAQKAQQNAARNVVEGYKKAGLSPALAAAGNFSPAQASMPSVPMPDVSAPRFDSMDLSQNVLTSAAVANENATITQKNAETGLIDAQRKNLELQNDYLADKFNAADDNVRGFLEKGLSQLETALGGMEEGSDDYNATKDMIDSLRDKLDSRKFTTGSQDALNDWQDVLQNISATDRVTLANKLQAAVIRRQNNDKTIGNIASMPNWAVEQARAEVAKLWSDIALNATQGNLNNALANESVARLPDIAENILSKQFDREQRAAGDKRYLASKGKVLGVLTNMFFDGYDAVMDMLPAVAAGATGGYFMREKNKASQAARDATKAARELRFNEKGFNELMKLGNRDKQRYAQTAYSQWLVENPKAGKRARTAMKRNIFAKYGLFDSRTRALARE